MQYSFKVQQLRVGAPYISKHADYAPCHVDSNSVNHLVGHMKIFCLPLAVALWLVWIDLRVQYHLGKEFEANEHFLTL